MLSSLNAGKTPLDRFISVVAWSISTTRPTRFGAAPYNPILGETHHVSKGNLNVLLEQVLVLSSCFWPLNALKNLIMLLLLWAQICIPIFFVKKKKKITGLFDLH